MHLHIQLRKNKRDMIYDNFNRVLLSVLESLVTLPRSQNLFILQSFIVIEEPPQVIEATLNKRVAFLTALLVVYKLMLLSSPNFPGIMECKKIVEAVLATLESSIVFRVCLRNGLHWENAAWPVMKKF